MEGGEQGEPGQKQGYIGRPNKSKRLNSGTDHSKLVH